MKQFNTKALLESPKRIMRYFGLWPESNPSRLYKMRGLFAFTILTIGTLLFFQKSSKDMIEGKYEAGCYAMCMTLVAFHEAFKVWLLLTNKTAFFEILANLEDQALLYHEDSIDIYLQTQLKFGHKLFNALMTLCLNAGITIISSEYVYGYKTSPRLLPIQADTNNLILYISVWILLIVIISYCALVIGSFEGLVAIFLSTAIGQLKVLHQEIIQAIDVYPSDINLTKEEIQYYDQRVNKLLSKCVKRHNAIERYIRSIEDKFSLSFLAQYIITLGVTGLLGLNFIFTPITSPDFVNGIFFFIADLIQVFVLCYNCHEIMRESENIRDACYLSNWMACGAPVRKTLCIIMERTKRPFRLTISKFSVISLNTFLMIMKTSMSYFTALESIYGDHSNRN